MNGRAILARLVPNSQEGKLSRDLELVALFAVESSVVASAAVWVSGAQPLGHVRLFVTPMDCNPPGSSVHGIPQARILEWVAISSARGSSRHRD